MGDKKPTLFEQMSALALGESVEQAASELGATRVEGIPGLWNVPGYTELSTTQMVSLWHRQNGR